MPNWYLDLISLVEQLPRWVRFLALLASTAIEYLLPVFPGDSLVVALGLLGAHSTINLYEVFLAIALGTIVGSASTYGLGRALASKRFSFNWSNRLLASARFQLFKRWYGRWAYVLLLINRFFPGIRSGFFIAAGLSRLAMLPTLTAALVSGLVFNGGLYGLGFLAGHNLARIHLLMQRYNIVVYCFMFIIGLILLIWWLKK